MTEEEFLSLKVGDIISPDETNMNMRRIVAIGASDYFMVQYINRPDSYIIRKSEVKRVWNLVPAKKAEVKKNIEAEVITTNSGKRVLIKCEWCDWMYPVVYMSKFSQCPVCGVKNDHDDDVWKNLEGLVEKK